MLQTMSQDFKLQLPNGCKHRVGVSHVWVAQYLYNTFFIKLLHAATELFEL